VLNLLNALEPAVSFVTANPTMTMDVLTVNAVITLTEIENVSKWKLVALNTQGALA